MIKKLFVATLLLLLGAAAYLYWEYQNFTTSPLEPGAEAATVLIAPGTSYRGVIEVLAEKGYTRDDWRWWLLGRLDPNAMRLQAGEFHFDPSLTPPQALALLSSNQVVQHSFTIVEGWTYRQMLAALRADPTVEHTLPPDIDGAELMTRLGSAIEHPEGWFLPETYQHSRGATDVEILTRVHNAMREALDAAWARRAEGLPYRDPYEALIMASIIEKETGLAEEREQIAGVFVRRLELGMRLQTDPTVIYGLGDSFDGNLTRAHLNTDGEYNTYARHGLPPTPIALPGRAAIEAALHPAPGEALYFVSRGDGSHVFSATLADHEAAVDRYQRGR